MTALRPCSACKRHVRASATACPFCNAALMPGRGQFVKPSTFARAAVFSAALAGCGDHKKPTPPPAHAGSAQGSDDLENLLDQQPRTADHAATDAGPVDAAVQVATPEDAAVAVDAGLDPQQLAEKKRKAEELHKKRLLEQQRRREEQEIETQIQRDHINAKPYGAPPARRRVV